jgi:hypothetical protein
MSPVFPSGRTYLYSVWSACERFGIRPPGVEQDWDDCVPWVQSMMLGYNEIRCHEDVKLQTSGFKI